MGVGAFQREWPTHQFGIDLAIEFGKGLDDLFGRYVSTTSTEVALPEASLKTNLDGCREKSASEPMAVLPGPVARLWITPSPSAVLPLG